MLSKAVLVNDLLVIINQQVETASLVGTVEPSNAQETEGRLVPTLVESAAIEDACAPADVWDQNTNRKEQV